MTDEKKLTKDSTVKELFEYFDISEGGVRVAPITFQEDPVDTRLALIVRGDIDTASVIFAEVYRVVEDLAGLQAQQEADDKPRIVSS
jgi:hypothetical protein